MKQFGPLILFVLLPFFLLTSCKKFKEPDFKSIDNLRLGSVSLSASTLFMDLRYFNPNPSKLKLKGAEGDAWVEGNLLGHFIVDSLIIIPANADFSVPVKLQVDMSKVLKNSFSAFLSNEVLVKLEGKARVGKGGFYINYPIHYEGKQNLNKLFPNGFKL